jgi:hypothetical protein
LYSSLTIFTNSTLDIDFSGPKVIMKFNNLVRGDYELQVTLKNSKTSKMFTSNLTVIPKRELEARPVRIEKVSDTIVPSIPLADRMEFNEPVYYASLYNKDPEYLKYFELRQRLTEV